MKMIKLITPMIVFYFSPFCLSLLAEETKPCDVFVELAERINQSDKSVTQINAIADDVKTAIQGMDLTDYTQEKIDLWKLRNESERAVKLLTLRIDFKQSKPSDLIDPVIECIALYLEKVQSYIDPEWQWQDIPLKVVPPDGVPMRMPGMNPDAIEDPDLKAEYLRRIEESSLARTENGRQQQLHELRSSVLQSLHMLAKSQQYPHWTKESVEARFGTSPELLAAIREYWQEEEQ